MSRPIPVEPPAHIAGLPKDSRGYFVPAEVPWLDHGPDIAGMDPHQTAALAFVRACNVCGFQLPSDAPVWRNFSQKAAAHARLEGRQLSIDPGFAGHLSCMLYSAFACPYWASSAGRLGKASLTEPGARRGTRPAILGYADVCYFVGEDPNRAALGPDDHPLIGYVDLTEDIGFRDPSDLLDRYERAVEADAATIDVAGPRAYWRRNDADGEHIQRVIDDAFATMSTTEPIRYIRYADADYMAYPLPLSTL